MKEKELLKRVAFLETREDHLITEIEYLNNLLIQVGFERGIQTLKAAAEAMVSHPEIGCP